MNKLYLSTVLALFLAGNMYAMQSLTKRVYTPSGQFYEEEQALPVYKGAYEEEPGSPAVDIQAYNRSRIKELGDKVVEGKMTLKDAKKEILTGLHKDLEDYVQKAKAQ